MASLRRSILLSCLALTIACVWPASGSAQYIAPDPDGDEFATVPAPPPGKFFGFNEDIIDFSHGQSPAAFIDYLDIAGGNIVKTTLDWWRAEYCIDPDTGQPANENCEPQWVPRRWEVWEDAYDAARARGVTPLFVLASAPTWARENPTGQTCQSCRYPPRSEMDAQWGEFVTEVATRFPESIIQVWNEPNLHIWWGQASPDPERYAELVKVAYDAVQAVELANPGVEIPVLAPGLANVADTPEVEADPLTMSMRDFLDAAYAAPASLADHIDGVAVNMFPHSNLYGANTLLASSFQDVRQAQATAGDDSKIYVTETGLPSGFDFPYTELDRAIALFRLYNRLMTMPDVAGVIFHRIIEPVDNNPVELEIGYAWMKFAPPPQPQTQAAAPEPKLVYCLFAELAKGFYPQCLEATITGGPSGRVRRLRVRFRFEGTPSSTLTTTFGCSLDGRRFKRCASGQRYRGLEPGKHVFKVRARNSNGDVGAPATRAFRVTRKR